MDRNVNVDVVFKAGTVPNKILQGLEKLHNARRRVLASRTWKDILMNECQVDLDPRRYSVKKGAQQGPKHHLSEPVGNLINEFKRPLDSYTVYVVENQKVHKAGGSPIKSPVQMQVRTGQANVNTPPPVPVVENGVNRSTPPAQAAPGPSRLVSGQRNQMERGTPPVATSTPKENFPHHHQRRNFPAPVLNGSGKRPADAPARGPDPKRRYVEDEMGGPLGLNGGPTGRRPEEVDEEEADAYSDSQDSQVDDLPPMGITLETLRPGFRERATKYNNSELLKARQEVIFMRDTNPDRYRKWCLKMPRVTFMVKDLLGLK